MYHCESSFTVCCIAGAAGGVDVCVRRSTYTHMRVPDSNIARIGASHIHLQDDSTRRDISDCKAHVLNLGNIDIAGVADLYDRLWIAGVAKRTADPRYHGPGFSNNASSGWDEYCGFDNVNAVREVGDLGIGSINSQDSVQRG